MKLVEMSISAGVLILSISFLRISVFRKLQKRVFVGLWMIVLARMLLPADMPLENGIATPVVKLLQMLRGSYIQTGQMEGTRNVAGTAMSKAASLGIAEPKIGSSVIVLMVWAAGMAGLGSYFLYCFVREYRLLSQALPMSHNMQTEDLSDAARRIVGLSRRSGGHGRFYIHDRISSPLVWGICRQRIVFPKHMVSMGTEQMKYVLAHEMVHMRRHDNFWKLLSAAALCIHWFNPLAWVMYVLFARDLELSCDERVVSLYGRKDREAYAMALITLVQGTDRNISFCSGFGKNPVKERIEEIMKYKKLTGMGVFYAVLLLAVATTVFATNEKAVAKTGQEAVETESARIETVKDGEAVETKASDETEEYRVVAVKDGKEEKIELKVKDDAVVEEIDPEDGSMTVKVGDDLYYVEFDHAVTVNDEEVVLTVDQKIENAEGEEVELVAADGSKGSEEETENAFESTILVTDGETGEEIGNYSISE